MIYGIGTDIVAVSRMAELLERHGERAMGRVLAAEEIPACRAAAQPERFMAKRFAAKEALGKALGTGIRAPVLLTSIAVGHDALGKPYFSFSPELAGWLEARNLAAHVSISDEREFAIAYVIVEQR